MTDVTHNYSGWGHKVRLGAGVGAVAFSLLLLTGCHIDMWQQNKDKAQSESTFFPDGLGSRPLVAHTVDRDHLRTDEEYYTGTPAVGS